MFATKGFLFAILVVGVVLVANVHCAPEQVDPESLPIRVRRQLPGFPQIPGVPDPSSIPGVGSFQKADSDMWIGQIITIIYQLIQGGSLAKNIPGADSISGSVPRLSRSVPETAAYNMEPLMIRFKREARGTGNLPTKTG